MLGTQEHFEDFCLELEQRFGWTLGQPLWANRTQPDEIPDSLIERIREDNALDLELYEFARDLCEERARRAVRRRPTRLSSPMVSSSRSARPAPGSRLLASAVG